MKISLTYTLAGVLLFQSDYPFRPSIVYLFSSLLNPNLGFYYPYISTDTI